MLMDDPPNPVPVELALVVKGSFGDAREAYTRIAELQRRFEDMVNHEWPTLGVSLSQAMFGTPDDERNQN